MWYKTAIIYELDVKVFYDSTGNGTGDLQGVISKLDYIDSMGFNCIWLLPFYPSPKKDNGYDVKDYYGVDPELGDLGDFAQLVDECDKRGIKIIIDLVVNHTSIEHPWFLDSQSSRKSKYRDFYIWQDNPDKGKEEVMLEEVNESVWEYSRKTRSYYLHKYFKHQADLNMANPEVIMEILRIMEFWLKLGVSGFRIDAAHVITDPVDVDHIDFGNLHTLFEKMNDLIREKKPSAVLLGEASVPPEDTREYFLSDGGSPRLHMLFNFISNKHTFLAFARKKGKNLTEALSIYKDIEPAHWVNFVRHHDELNLELLSDSERKEVWAAFAPEENMRMFGHGIRRRLRGSYWPPKQVRNERLKASVDIMRALWNGETVSVNGPVKVGEARLYTRPRTEIHVAGAAITPETAKWMASWADGLITVSQPEEKPKKVVEAWKENGGENKPMKLKVQLSYDKSFDDALNGAHEQWKTNVFGSDMLAELRHLQQFEQAAQHVKPEELQGLVNISNETGRHIEWIEKYIDMGFTELVLHNVNKKQEQFIEVFAEKVLPELRS